MTVWPLRLAADRVRRLRFALQRAIRSPGRLTPAPRIGLRALRAHLRSLPHPPRAVRGLFCFRYASIRLPMTTIPSSGAKVGAPSPRRRWPTSIYVGVWIWGFVTILLAFGCLGVVIWAGFRLTGETKDGPVFADAASPVLKGMYLALERNGSLMAGILGFSGLAWAHFFQVNNPTSSSDATPKSESSALT